MSTLAAVARILETYRGRDRALRLTSYIGMFLAGDGKTSAQLKWRVLSEELSACRTILRLFDDLPMLLSNLSTSFGLTEKGILRPLQFVISLLNQSYYLIDHIAYLRRKKILEGNSSVFALLGLANWALSLLGEIIKSLVQLRRLQIHAKRLHKQQDLDKNESGSESSQNVEIRENLRKLSAEQKDLLLLLVQYGADFINAVSWLPPGILWSQKLRPATNGVIGIIASLIMFYRNWPSHATT